MELPNQPPMRSAEGDPGKRARVSLIVAVYKRADFLGLVLQSVEKQSYNDIEVIIAEDDQSEDIRQFILGRKETFRFPIKHVSQQDRGFRKNRILNKAIMASEGEHLIFIDGDCILHKKFIEAHVNRLKPNTCLFGRRAMLSRKLTERLIRSGNISRISIFAMLVAGGRHLEDGIYTPWIPSFRKSGIKGCNFSLPRDLMYSINGFDEDFENIFGGEDDDVERRLKLAGAKLKCTKFKTIQYHLHHGGREGRAEIWETIGRTFHQNKIKERRSYCENGLTQNHRAS